MKFSYACILSSCLLLTASHSAYGGKEDKSKIVRSVSDDVLSPRSVPKAEVKASSIPTSQTIQDFQSLNTETSSSEAPKLRKISKKDRSKRVTSSSSSSQDPSSFGFTEEEGLVHPKDIRKKIFLLSLDGGGIRGIIHAHVLSRIEELFQKRSSKIFSAVSGASTGALVGIGIGIPDPKNPGKPLYSAQDILSLYLNERENMFEKRSLAKRIASVKGLLGPRYAVKKMEQTLQQYFGSNRLSDLVIPTFVPAVEVLKQKGAMVFSSLKARAKPHRDYKVWEISRAAIAAPSFFESKELLEDATGQDQDTILNFWDGGLFAHNPSEIAFIEAQRVFPDTSIDDFILVSIGTGEDKFSLSQEATRNMGYANGGAEIFKTTMSSQNAWVEKKMKKLLGQNYIRLQVNLDAEGVFMDDLSAAYLEKLYFATETMLDQNQQKILTLKDVWDSQRGRKTSKYDLVTQAQSEISRRYLIPLENKKAIHKIYQDYCKEHKINSDEKKAVRKLVRHMKSQTSLSLE